MVDGITSFDTSQLPEISSVSAATVQSASPMTVLEIESPLEVRPAMVHEYIGSTGPNKRESEGIQRALDWLTEKRSVDYGWGNDTHMVILAKEVWAYKRLQTKRNQSFTWFSLSHSLFSSFAIIRQLSGARDLMDTADLHVQIIDDLEGSLSVKQMTIDILMLLDQHRHALTPKAMDVEKLARFILALGLYHSDVIVIAWRWL